MRISYKNRVRLIAAAAGVTLFLNPGQAAADEGASPQGSTSQGDTPSSSDGSAGTDTSADDSGTTTNDSGGESGGDPSPGDGGSPTDGGSSGDGSGSGDGNGESTGDVEPSGTEMDSGAPASDTPDSDTPDSGTPDTTSTDNGSVTTEPTTPFAATTPPATITPADSGQSGGTGSAGHGSTSSDSTPPSTPTANTTLPATDQSTFSTPGTATGTAETDPGEPGTTEPAATSTDTTTNTGAGTEQEDSTEPGTTPIDTPQMLVFSTPESILTETGDTPETFARAAFLNPAPTTPPATTGQALAGLLTFLGLPPVGSPTTTTFTTNPAPWTLLWWVQRTQSLLNNQTPTATPTLTPTTNGYTISLNATDPDGDPLTTTITTEPANGTATLNGNGTITYIPNPGSTTTDQFTVQLSDTGPHLHGLAGLLSFFTGHNPHNRYVTVTVPEFTPTNQPPEIVAGQQPTIEADLFTGIVTVTGLAKVVTDPENGPLTYTSTDPAVLFDAQNPDSFTWTPTPQTRHDAAVPGAPNTHTITVTADDGDGGTVDLTLTVPIVAYNEDPTLAVSPPSAPALGSGTSA